MKNLLKESSHCLALISGGEDSPTKVITKIDFFEDKEHSNDRLAASVGLSNADNWNFYFNGDISNNGNKSLGVQFEFSID